MTAGTDHILDVGLGPWGPIQCSDAALDDEWLSDALRESPAFDDGWWLASFSAGTLPDCRDWRRLVTDGRRHVGGGWVRLATNERIAHPLQRTSASTQASECRTARSTLRELHETLNQVVNDCPSLILGDSSLRGRCALHRSVTRLIPAKQLVVAGHLQLLDSPLGHARLA
jgi:hypothetical protein